VSYRVDLAAMDPAFKKGILTTATPADAIAKPAAAQK
jgi:hypothetical protein